MPNFPGGFNPMLGQQGGQSSYGNKLFTTSTNTEPLPMSAPNTSSSTISTPRISNHGSYPHYGAGSSHQQHHPPTGKGGHPNPGKSLADWVNTFNTQQHPPLVGRVVAVKEGKKGPFCFVTSDAITNNLNVFASICSIHQDVLQYEASAELLAEPNGRDKFFREYFPDHCNVTFELECNPLDASRIQACKMRKIGTVIHGIKFMHTASV